MTHLDRIILTHRALFTRGSDIASVALFTLALTLASTNLLAMMNITALILSTLLIFRIRTIAIISVFEENMYQLATR